MNNLPSFQFYPGDWRKDLAVQSLSYHDRGVWHEIFCLMHESEQRGVLLLKGKPMPTEVLARVLGLDKQSLERTLETLVSYGVATKDEQTGALICEWMVKQEKIRQIRKEAGAKGGNPNLVNQKSNQTLNQNPTTLVNQNPTPSSSSSSSTKETSTNVDEKKGETPTQRKKKTKLVDKEFLDSLKTNRAYQGINVDIEFAKAETWCSANRRELNTRFFINWMNRATPTAQPKPKDDSGLYKTIEQLRAERENVVITLPPKREVVANVR